MREFTDETASVDRLLMIFKNACLEQYDTYLTDEIDYRNKLYDILVTIKDELKTRGPEARRSLTRLLNDENPQVRLQAAKFVYPVAREEARKCLEDLKTANLPDQSLDAGMTLYFLEEKPDSLDN